MKSVAIIGFSEKTFPYCKYTKADEIWTLNYAFLIKEEMPEPTRMFEIHKRDWYLRKEVKKSAEYEKWLQTKHPFPIYMQESELTPEVPSGVRYPYEEICEKYLKNLVRVDYETGEEKYDEYFTSSFAFMLALAIYEEFDEIEIFGIDMEINTEYGYQKPNGEFWIGIALGRGIKVKLPKPCFLCNALVYGYDAIPYIDPPRVKELIEIYQEKSQKYFDEAEEYSRQFSLDSSNKELEDKWMEASSWAYAYRGAISAASKLILESDTYISRQFVEIKRDSYINGMDYWKGVYNNKKAIHDHLFEQNMVDMNVWKEILDARANMFMNMGALQLHKQLINIMDMRPIKYELAMEIKESEKMQHEDRYMGDDLESI